MTRIHIGLMPAVAVQLSDGLRRIPDHDGWDLAVGNPPHFNSVNRIGWIRSNDLDWALHGLHRRYCLRLSGGCAEAMPASYNRGYSWVCQCPCSESRGPIGLPATCQARRGRGLA